MRKRITATRQTSQPGEANQAWLDLQQIATVEVTSEDPRYPVEKAFSSEVSSGWRAGNPGHQQIRLIFDQPVDLRRIQLRFQEAEQSRTQEFSLLCHPASGGPPRELLRQQWNFSPTGSTTEIEDYTVELSDVSALELNIEPDVSRREATATLASWRVA